MSVMLVFDRVVQPRQYARCLHSIWLQDTLLSIYLPRCKRPDNDRLGIVAKHTLHDAS